jgi:hypothetical protein
MSAFENGKLLPEDQVLDQEIRTALKSSKDAPEQESKKTEHASLLH